MYKNKYLKYKRKYILLKGGVNTIYDMINTILGSDLPIIPSVHHDLLVPYVNDSTINDIITLDTLCNFLLLNKDKFTKHQLVVSIAETYKNLYEEVVTNSRTVQKTDIIPILLKQYMELLFYLLELNLLTQTIYDQFKKIILTIASTEYDSSSLEIKYLTGTKSIGDIINLLKSNKLYYTYASDTIPRCIRIINNYFTTFKSVDLSSSTSTWKHEPTNFSITIEQFEDDIDNYFSDPLNILKSPIEYIKCKNDVLLTYLELYNALITGELTLSKLDILFAKTYRILMNFIICISAIYNESYNHLFYKLLTILNIYLILPPQICIYIKDPRPVIELLARSALITYEQFSYSIEEYITKSYDFTKINTSHEELQLFLSFSPRKQLKVFSTLPARYELLNKTPPDLMIRLFNTFQENVKHMVFVNFLTNLSQDQILKQLDSRTLPFFFATLDYITQATLVHALNNNTQGNIFTEMTKEAQLELMYELQYIYDFDYINSFKIKVSLDDYVKYISSKNQEKKRIAEQIIQKLNTGDPRNTDTYNTLGPIISFFKLKNTMIEPVGGDFFKHLWIIKNKNKECSEIISTILTSYNTLFLHINNSTYNIPSIIINVIDIITELYNLIICVQTDPYGFEFIKKLLLSFNGLMQRLKSLTHPLITMKKNERFMIGFELLISEPRVNNTNFITFLRDEVDRRGARKAKQ